MADTSEFNDRLASWLADPSAKYLDSEQYTRNASDGALAAMRALEAIHGPGHERCGRDTRDRTVLVRVVGNDYVDTVVSVGADDPLGCFVGVLAQDDTVLGVQVLGWDPDEVDPEPDELVTEAEGMRIESDVAGMVATYTPANLAPTRGRWWHRFTR
jgi:hypothetical protein